MIPLALIDQHRRAQANVVTLSERALRTLFRNLPSDAVAATELLLVNVPAVVTSLGEVAATEAADFYDEARSSSRPAGTFRAATAPAAPVEQIEAMVRWGVTPLWAVGPRLEAALARIAGGTARLVRQPGRHTVLESTEQDPARPRYARYPNRGACDFCLMLASRGAVYTEDTATAVTGRTMGGPGTRGGPITTTRGSQAVGEPFHDSCGCEAVPVWTPDDLPPINRELQAEWAEHASQAPDPIAAWREHVATRN